MQYHPGLCWIKVLASRAQVNVIISHMSKNALKIIYGAVALIALIGLFKFAERYGVTGNGNIPAGGNNVSSSSNEGQTSLQAGIIEYRDEGYGLAIDLPSSWQGYSIVKGGGWTGYNYIEGKGDVVITSGPGFSIRHPEWTTDNPRQDIPIMIFTLEQWADLSKEKFHLGTAAPIGPTGLGRNSKYVFALPARYNYAFLPGWEEVERIINDKSLKFFN